MDDICGVKKRDGTLGALQLGCTHIPAWKDSRSDYNNLHRR